MIKFIFILVIVLCIILFDLLCILGVGIDSLVVVCVVIDGVMVSFFCE